MQPRDPSLPVESYRALIDSLDAEITHTENMHVDALLFSASRSSLRIALALYSAGESADRCLSWFRRAANYEIRAMQGRKYRFGGFGDTGFRLELFSAAYLGGSARDLVEAFAQCEFRDPPGPGERALTNQFGALFAGRPLAPEEIDVQDLKKTGAAWHRLPAVLQGIAKRDVSAFSGALAQYLLESWAGAAERSAGIALRSHTPEYAGKWCILSAAVCSVIKAVADLPQEAAIYVPFDLITSER